MAEDQASSDKPATVPTVYFGASYSDIATLAHLYRECSTRLDRYAAAVNDGQELQAALDFGGFILWSGVTSLCRKYSQDSPKIDGALLRWKAEELQRAVREKWNNREQIAKLDEKQIAGINRRLDVLAAAVTRCHFYCKQ